MDPVGLQTKSDHRWKRGVTDRRMDGSVACSRWYVLVGAPGYVIVYNDICDIFFCLTQDVYTRQIILGFEPKADKIKSYKIHSERREG